MPMGSGWNAGRAKKDVPGDSYHPGRERAAEAAQRTADGGVAGLKIQKYRKGEFIMSKEDKEVLDMANGVREKTEPVKLEKKVSGGVGKYLPKGSCRRWPEFGRLISEVAGWTGFGAVVLGGMLAGVFPMGAAVPVFIGCFGWVAIRVDRFFRG